MADVRSALLRLRLAEDRVKRAADLAHTAAGDPNKRGLFLATARDLASVKTGFDADYLAVEAAADPATGFDPEAHVARIISFENYYYSAMAAVESFTIEERARDLKEQTKSISSGNSHVALPKIVLPHFNGNPREWMNFANLFTTLVTTNANLTEVERLVYLKTALSDEPLQLIQSLTITDVNFKVAWKLLTDRYDNKRLIISVHVEALLQAPFASADAPASLRHLLTVITENVAALAALDVPVSQWDLILLPILCKRLDVVLQTQWEMTLTGQDLPSLAKFTEYLEKHCRAQEAVISSRGKVPTTQITRQKNFPSFAPVRKSVLPKYQSANTFLAKSETHSCQMCSSAHSLFKCSKFNQLSPTERYSVVRQHRLCLNCLRSSHQAKNCLVGSSCRHCGSRHHSLLHFEDETCEDEQGDAAPDSAEGQSTVHDVNPTSTLSTVTSCSAVHSVSTVLLSTAQVQIHDVRGNPHTFRALLDSASQASFISERCFQCLSLPRKNAHLPIEGLSNTPVNVAKSYTSLVISPVGEDSPRFALDAFILPRIANSLPSVQLPSDTRQSVVHLKLADPSFDIPGAVDLLLGADLFPQLLTGGKLEGSPMALNSVLGWVLMGKVETASCRTATFVTSMVTTISPLEEVMKRFWELEEFPHTHYLSQDDTVCEELFKKTHCRSAEGRYSVALPFRNPEPELGTSRSLALSRFERLERRLSDNVPLHGMYSDFMKDYLMAGHMEKVPKSQIDCSTSFYIPHHCIIKPDSSTTKLRVVFDASAKGSTGVSLNDELLTGPKLQQDIVKVLSNFRLHPVVFTADIKQMYRQIGVHREHQDFQRIVWRFNKSEPVEDYRLKTVTYGVSSAPYLAIRTLHQLAADEREQFPTASRTLLSDIYVDDVVTGADSVDAALELQRELMTLLDKGGFMLRKFMSNNPVLLEWLPPDAVQLPRPFSMDQDSEVIVKVLGLQWNPLSDTYSYNVQASSESPTKRSILSNLARVFDPLGFLTPLTMFAKSLIQELWLKKLDWDTVPPPEIVRVWECFSKDLPHLSSLTVPRHVKGCSDCSYELHGFCDSSEKGYAAVVYLRVSCKGDVKVHLLVAKSKVAPVKVVSLPRLELCGALVLARLLQHTLAIYKHHIKLQSITAWTDSQVVLAWVNTAPHQLKTFVANRVSEIQDCTETSWWRHVRSEDNPADCASRGLLPVDLLNHSLWWCGPQWLRHQPSQWPVQIAFDDMAPDSVVLEKKNLTLISVVTPHQCDQLLERCSRLSRLLHVTCYVLRFIHNCRAKQAKLVGQIGTHEIKGAMMFWVKRVQAIVFEGDITALKNDKCTSPQLRKLVPFLDPSGTVRVGGRLPQSSLPFEHKHPILLPKTHRFTDLIISHYHELNQHPGLQTLQGILRETFWIIADKQAIRRRLGRCLKCFKARPSTQAPLMGDLPAMRVQQVKPFSKAGVDYAGPFTIKMARIRRPTLLKAYMCIFVCCTTKAVHVELASDLSTEVFIGAYKRFIARRGRSSDIYSDCGTNFVGARNHLQELQQLLSSSEHQKGVTESLQPLGVTWHFNPPSAPHFGGLWEAGVKSFKTHLRRVIGEQVLTYEELYTALVQVEAILNSRPLCPLSSDPNDLKALTPGHFLTLEPLVTLPEPTLEAIPIGRLQRFQLVERLHQDFWKRWHQDYLHTLQQRGKWSRQDRPMVPDQLVLLKDDRIPPLQWRLGRIIQLHPGNDNIPRVATVRTSNGMVKRPAVKLCPLPVEF